MVFSVKNWTIWNFWGGILGVDKVFGDILNSKQSTLEEKNVHICEWPKNWSFSNGSSPANFVKKWKFWNWFFFGKTSLEKAFGDVLYS